MASEPKWTKRPWRREHDAAVVWGNCDPDDKSTFGMGLPVAKALGPGDGRWGGPSVSEDEQIANADLIAAAPDLFDALLSVREFVQDELDNRDCAGGDATDYVNDAKRALEIIDGAIAKAMGEG